ncbi:MAG: transketolase [Lachnospiraceae bacterium]|nr:transketolase [Lachnospiraceae bacterium]
MNEADLMKQYRREMFLTAYPHKTAHLASAFSIAEILYVLYRGGILRFRAEDPAWPDRDRFILSKGHAALAVYVMLHDIGVLDDAKMRSFCRPGDSLGGELHPLETAGVEAATGSLGHGLGFGVGCAMALKANKSEAQVYVLVGNGELGEGVIWEGVMAAHKFALDNLTVILDDNRLQKMGFTSDIMRITSWREKWEAFGWRTAEVDGHDIAALTEVLSEKNTSGEPRVIIAHTVKGKGVSLMEDNADWHFKMPYKKELKTFMEELDITEQELSDAKVVSTGAV